MRVIDTENILLNMKDDTAFVLKSEEVFHDKVSMAAAKLLRTRTSRPVVCLTGPSGSGKTTTAMRLKDYLENLDIRVCMLSMDNFFLPLEKRPPEADDFESPYCVDRDRLSRALTELSEGKEVELPVFDFATSSIKRTFTMQGHKDAIIIVEGIHMLNPLIFDQVSDIANGIYVAPRTRVVTPEDKIIRPEQIRIVRRMLRDYTGRGRSLKDTILSAASVDAGEMRHIQPYKQNANIHIDTFHDYELCIMSQYLQDMPEAMSELSAEFLKEHDLDTLFDLLSRLPKLKTAYIPRDSIVREFIGGSRYEY